MTHDEGRVSLHPLLALRAEISRHAAERGVFERRSYSRYEGIIVQSVQGRVEADVQRRQ